MNSPFRKAVNLTLAFLILALAIFPVPGGAVNTLARPVSQSEPVLDESGNLLNQADLPELQPLQPQGTDADPAILCYTTRTATQNPCARIGSLFSGVVTISSVATFPVNLAPYDVIVIGYDEGTSLNSLAPTLNTYIQNGGGLLVSQPNLEGQVTIFPPGFEMNVASIFWPEYPSAPGPVQFTVAGFFHPILRGLTSQDPSGNFDTVPLNSLGPAWTVLVKSVNHPNVALSVGSYGTGRLAFETGNISPASLDSGSDVYVRQLIEWLSAGDAPPGPDMQITKIEVTQAIQDLNNSVDLIANKRTYVRVHVSSPSTMTDVSANLSARRGTTTLYPTLLPGNPGADITVKTSPDRGQLNDSFWFELPNSWTNSGNVTLTARLDPANAKNDPNLSNNTRSVTVNFLATPAMRLRIVNVRYTTGGNTYLASNTHLNLLESWLRRAYPIHNLNVKRQTFNYPTNGLPDVDALHTQLALIKLIRFLFTGESLKTVYYGIVDDGGGFMRGKAAGIPGTIAAGPTGSDTWGWDTDGSYGDWYGGHEIAHTRNRFHAMFCGAGGGTTYPYTTGRISPTLTGDTAIYGFDITTRAIYPPSWKDVMTYCSNQWVSDFTYEGLRSYIVSVGPSAGPAVIQAEQVLLVTGLALLDEGTAELYDVQQLDLDASLEPVEPGDWSIAQVSGGGADLLVTPFMPQELTDVEDSPGRPGVIAEVVPFAAGASKVEIRYQGVVVASRSASPNAPVVNVTEPDGGEYRSKFDVAWDASDPDGNPLTFTVLFSNDGGKSWQILATGVEGTSLELDGAELPGGESLIKVIANDGFNSTEGTSQPFYVYDHAPDVDILSPEEEAIFYPAQSVVLEGSAYDMEDGTIDDDAAFTWSSDLSGDLGTGRILDTVDLPDGAHLITLEVTDSDGRTGTAQRTIHVVPAETPEVINLEVAPFNIGVVVYEGDPAETQPLSVRTSSGDLVGWSATGGAAWLSLDAASGETPSDQLLTVNPQGLAPGIYEAILIFQSGEAENSPLEVPVVLEVLQRPILSVYLPSVHR